MWVGLSMDAEQVHELNVLENPYFVQVLTSWDVRPTGARLRMYGQLPFEVSKSDMDKEFTARLGLGEPMGLDDEGVEERGSFTLRKANPESGFISLAAYDKLDHPIKCTLKGYRRLGGAFHGQLVYTGYKKVWTGQKQILTGSIPPGSSGEFDVITCEDIETGEVQHFRTSPALAASTVSSGNSNSFADPNDSAFQDSE